MDILFLNGIQVWNFNIIIWYHKNETFIKKTGRQNCEIVKIKNEMVGSHNLNRKIGVK